MVMKNISLKLGEITKNTKIGIHSYRLIRGSESLIIEVNGKWVFRFPKSGAVNDKNRKQWSFLVTFSKLASISVPKPEYIQKGFIGYKKLAGKQLRSTSIEKLTTREKTKVARQLGLFLKVLHSRKDKRINFDTGYLVMRRSDYLVCPKEIARHLNKSERDKLTDKLRAIANNSLNFKKPKNIIHGDLNFNNILWNKDKKITGILDWSDMGLGIPAMDFIGLADFSTNKNDQFLREVLKWYGAKDDKLFFQIKENSIIEVMNWFWFYRMHNDRGGLSGVIKKLKRMLSREYFNSQV